MITEDGEITYKLRKSLLAPGSFDAIEAGCKCPEFENHHGDGYLGGIEDENGEIVYVISWICPLHGVEEVRDSHREDETV